MAGEKRGLKLRRQSKGKVYYAMQFKATEANKRKRMRTHLRSHPMDVRGVKRYETMYGGRVADFGIKGRGLRRAARATNVAKQLRFDTAAQP